LAVRRIIIYFPQGNSPPVFKLRWALDCVGLTTVEIIKLVYLLFRVGNQLVLVHWLLVVFVEVDGCLSGSLKNYFHEMPFLLLWLPRLLLFILVFTYVVTLALFLLAQKCLERKDALLLYFLGRFREVQSLS